MDRADCRRRRSVIGVIYVLIVGRRMNHWKWAIYSTLQPIHSHVKSVKPN